MSYLVMCARDPSTCSFERRINCETRSITLVWFAEGPPARDSRRKLAQSRAQVDVSKIAKSFAQIVDLFEEDSDENTGAGLPNDSFTAQVVGGHDAKYGRCCIYLRTFLFHKTSFRVVRPWAPVSLQKAI